MVPILAAVFLALCCAFLVMTIFAMASAVVFITGLQAHPLARNSPLKWVVPTVAASIVGIWYYGFLAFDVILGVVL